MRRCPCAAVATTANPTRTIPTRAESLVTPALPVEGRTLIRERVAKSKSPLGGDARPTRMAVMGVALERRAAPGAIAGRGREAAPAVGAEDGVRFGARTVGRTSGMRDAGCGMRHVTGGYASRISHLASRVFSAEGRQRFGSVFRLQGVIVGV